jgi:hypothetical protein
VEHLVVIPGRPERPNPATVFLGLEGTVVSEHGVEGGEELSGEGDKGEFGGFTLARRAW